MKNVLINYDINYGNILSELSTSNIESIIEILWRNFQMSGVRSIWK